MTTRADLSSQEWQRIQTLAHALNGDNVPANWVRQVADYLRSQPKDLPLSHYRLLRDYLVRLRKSRDIFLSGGNNAEQRAVLAKYIARYIPDVPRSKLLLMLYWTVRLMKG